MKTRISLFVALLLLACATRLHAQGAAFTYQGILSTTNGPANGLYDFTFAVFGAATGGSQVAGTLTVPASAVSNGSFSATLDFGAGVFTGPARWLEISVRTNGGASFGTLAPRQPILPSPYAIMASSASNLLGTLPPTSLSGTYGNAVTLNNPANQFSGNGSGLQLVNAASLEGLHATNFWQTGGNSGTAAPANFLGTSDNQPFEIHVNGQRALLFTPDPRGGGNNTPNLTANPADNSISVNGTGGAVIAGGGSPPNPNKISDNASGSFIGAGSGNFISTNSHDSVILGGLANSIQTNAPYSAVGGGQNNVIQPKSDHAAIGGGQINVIQTNAPFSVIDGGANNIVAVNSAYSTVGGGYSNTVAGGYATVPGGANNSALGAYSLAAGQQAKALNTGTFVWADSQSSPFSSTASDQFLIRAQGGVGIGTNAPAAVLHISSATGASRPQLRLDQTLNGDFSRLRFVSGTNPYWDVAVGGGAPNVMNWFVNGIGNLMTLNPNGNLSVAGAVTASSFSGNGIVGWQVPAGTAIQAASNTGYLLTNNASLVTLTLPASPSLTDVVRISGGGTGGWRISQNNGQSVLGTFANGSATTSGTTGYLTGGQGTAIEVQYIGNGQFTALSLEGAVQAH